MFFDVYVFDNINVTICLRSETDYLKIYHTNRGTKNCKDAVKYVQSANNNGFHYHLVSSCKQ